MHKTIFFILIALLVSACGGNSTPAVVATPVDTESLPAELPTPTKVYDTNFSLDNLNPTPPDDVIEEVAYYGGLNGGTSCEAFGSKQGIYGETSIEIMGEIYLVICHPAAKSIQIKVTRPDGQVEEFTENSSLTTVKGLGQADFSYIPDLSMPRGNYLFSFSGASWELHQTIEVLEPDSARLYLLSDQNQIVFYHFKPGERVRLFLYKPVPNHHYLMQGWKEFLMDGSGGLIVSADLKSLGEGEYAAVGELSGQAIGRPKGFGGLSFELTSMEAMVDIYCGNKIRQIGVRPGDYVQVIAPNQMIQNLTVPLTPLGTLQAGSLLKISEGPVCLDGSFWWYADCQNKTCKFSGYVRETEGSTQVLKVLTALPPTPTFDPANIPACPGAKPTRLKPNSQAKVSKVATQLTMRAQAGMNADKVHVIASGRLMNILADAPVCADNAYWWHVYVPEKAFEGWVREGDNKDYWIDPLP